MDALVLARSFTSLLLDTAAKGTVLLLLACLVAWLCRRSSAALRHSVWCMTMGGLLVLPVASWALPAWQIPILPPEPLPAPASVAEVVRLPPPVPEAVSVPALPPRMEPIQQFEPELPATPPAQITIKPAVSVSPVVVAASVPAPVPVIVELTVPPLTTMESTSLLVSAGWLSGVSLFGVLLLVGLWRTVKLRRNSQVVSVGEWLGMLVELRQRLSLSRSVELREHAESVVPLTWGIWRPVVLLPKLAREWAEPMRRAVLLHELAHVQRGDVACQVLGRLTCVLYWFHPLAWFALRQLRQEREQACDDAVIYSGERASDYAEQLLQVARLCCSPQGLSLGVAMAEGSSLERRVVSLFDSARSHGPLTRRVAIASLLVGGAILAGLAPIQPTASQAEPSKEAQPVPVGMVYEKAYQATVDISTAKKPDPSKPNMRISGMGAGIIVDSQGFIVTANHVVDGKDTIEVTLHDGTKLPASVVGQDPAHDLAVLKVHAPAPLVVMPENPNQVLKVFDEVWAIGNAFGWSHSVSKGIISGLGRDLELSEDQRYQNLIQTDAALNPGASGGPLLNAQGEAIGINIAIRAGAQKISFAIPIADARKVFVGLMRPIISGASAREQLQLLKPVFGEAKRGVQLGLAIGSLERTFPDKSRIPLWLFYRNVGDKELTFNLSQDFMNDPVSVTDASGKRVQVNFVMHWMFIPPLTITLKPGEVWCIATTGLNLGERMPGIKPVAGKYKLTYPQGIWSTELEERLETEGALAGQVVNSPTWSEQLETGTIEFEIAPSKAGALEARILANQPTADSRVTELLQKYRDSRQKLEPLHVQMRHIEEYTDAFRAHHRIQAERQEAMIPAIQSMTDEEFKKANPHMGKTMSAEYVRLSIKHNHDVNRSLAKMHNQTASDVELFQKGTAYQIRTRNNSRNDSPEPLSFPVEALTAGNLGTTYKEVGFYSWAPQIDPPGMIVYGSQPQYRQITSKPYHTNGGRPIPAFSNFVRTGSHDWHPIDAFFFQPPENYRVIGKETVDGRELVIVDVLVATSFSQGFANEAGESYQLKELHYHRAWLDPSRGALPIKLMIWHGNEKTDFATHVSRPPQGVMATQQLTEVVPGGWYPTLTTLDKYNRDEEKMPKAPPSGEGAEWMRYLEEVAKVPLVVHERETWKCELVEVPRTLTEEFFVLPTPAGAKIIDRDQQDLKEQYSLGLPVDEFAEVGSFLGKAWLMGPLSVLPGATSNETPEADRGTERAPVGKPKGEPIADLEIERVVWMDPVDGLQPGFWLQSTGEPLNLRVPNESLIRYRVAVRNTSDAEVTLLLRMRPFDGQELPYLIPSDQIVPALEQPEIPIQFRSHGQVNPYLGVEPSYVVKLAAGETVLVPGGGRLWVGRDEASIKKQYCPSIEATSPGMNWVVQPCLIQKLTDEQLKTVMERSRAVELLVAAKDGKSRQVPGAVVGEIPTGKPLYARIQLEVATLNAEAHRNAEKATWGENEQGIQCGIRLLNPQASYRIGDTLEAELLWRITAKNSISTTLPRKLDLYPIIEDAEGNEPQIDFGARFNILPSHYDFQPGEVHSLGTFEVKLVEAGTPSPRTNMEPGHITLPPGKYWLLGSGGVGNINPKSGKVAFAVAAPAAEPATAAQRTIRGTIIDEEKLGVPNAEVLIVGGTDWNRSIEGHVIAQGVTNEKGEFSIPIPESELQKKPWGQVWRRAPGYAAARGNSVQSLESLMEEPLTYGPLVKTDGMDLVVHDPNGKSLPKARVTVRSVRVNQGIGYPLPEEWREDDSGVSDDEGRVHLPYIDPGSVDRLEITPEGGSASTEFGPNYFLNYRPGEAAPHFTLTTYETGAIEGQLVAASGVALPKGLTIPLRTLTGKVGVSGVRDVVVDEAGRFQIPDMPIGEISILKFLDDAQPLRPWITARSYVKSGETTKLEIPIVTGTRVTGRVEKSDTKEGVSDYEFEVYYGPSIKFRGSDLWILKHPVKTDANGQYELLLPPGPINLRLTRYVDGYRDATSWQPREKRGGWGPLHEIPAQTEFQLPVIDLVKMLPVQGKLVDQNNSHLGKDDWSVYGFPEIPGEEHRFVMNSMAGVNTDKEGHFDGTYPEPYPPVRWKVSHRVWKTKYEFDDINYRAEVIQKEPLILQVNTEKPLAE